MGRRLRLVTTTRQPPCRARCVWLNGGALTGEEGAQASRGELRLRPNNDSTAPAPPRTSCRRVPDFSFKVPTPEQLAQEDVVNNCFTRSVIAAVMGVQPRGRHTVSISPLLFSRVGSCLFRAIRWRAGRRFWTVYGRDRHRASVARVAPLLPPHLPARRRRSRQLVKSSRGAPWPKRRLAAPQQRAGVRPERIA